jgi:hypothetical protein
VAYAPTGIGTATAVETVVLTDKSIDVFAGPLLPYYRNVAFADIVVPAPAPPPPTPKIAINLYTLDENNLRVPANGLITDGTPLIVALKVDSSISQPPNITINGAPYSTQPDAPDAANDPLKQDFELTDKFVSSGPGIYKIVATGLTAFAQTVTSSRNFMVVGAGSDNNVIKVGAAPEIVSTTPVTGAQGVPTDTFIQVLFSEPVTNIPDNISLVPDDGSTPPALQLSGIDYRNGAVISSLGSADAVSSLTIRPVSGLKYGMHYTIQATSGIKDLDNVADPTKSALGLVPPASPIGFSTFGPQVLGGTAPFSSTRVVVMGDRAYVAKYENATLSFVHAYDLSDPANPVEINIGTAGFVGRAQDTAGEENAPVIGGGNLLAVGAGVGAFEFGLPSNLWLYNVSGDQIQRVGAVSVTGSTVNEGQLVRVALHGNFAYSGTFPVGIQVVDLQQAISEYNDVFTNNPVQFGQAITTDGQGFARDAVINTIPVNDSAGRHFMTFGIQAGDFVVPGSDPANPTTQTYVVSAGTVPGAVPNTISFIVADPTSPGPPSYTDVLRFGGSSLDSGRAVTLGQLTDSILDAAGNPVQKSVAVVVGVGSASDPAVPGSFGQGGVLAVVDMSNPLSPQVLSMLKLETTPTDVLLNGTTALVGTGINKVLLVNLVDPRNPVNAGSITGSVFGDRLAVTKDGILVSSSLDGTRGGIQTASLGIVPKISVDTGGLVANMQGKSSEDIKIDYQILGNRSLVQSAVITVKDDTGKVVFSSPVEVKPAGSVVWPAGQLLHPTPDNIFFKVINTDGSPSSETEATAELQSGSAPTPVISGITPSRIETGTSSRDITIAGRNFLAGTQVVMVSSDGETTRFPASKFVSKSQITISLTADYFSQIAEWSLSLVNGTEQSTEVPLKVIPTGLPPTPTLDFADPAQLPSTNNAQDTWVTLHGTNFTSGLVVKTTHSDEQLDAQFVSDTEFRVLIPAAWQGGPFKTLVHLESSQDPDLRSGDVDFEVLNTLNFGPDPVIPAITNVNDGFVPLADPGSTQPLHVTLAGSDFGPGANVMAVVDGQETSLTVESTSDTNIVVQVPPSVFSAKPYTFQLTLAQSGTSTSLQATQQANAHKVKFGKFHKGKILFIFPHNFDEDCAGFHRRHIGSQPEDYFLMVPYKLDLQNKPQQNSAIAVIDKNELKPAGTQVTFDLDDPSAVSRTPAFTTNPQETITLSGLTNQSADVINNLKAQKNAAVNGAQTQNLLGVLGLYELTNRNINVNLTFVKRSNSDNVNTLPSANKMADFVQRLETALNDIWEPQTRVHFTVHAPPQTAAEVIAYDLNSDGGLEVAPGPPSPGMETFEITSKSVLGTPAPNSINIYFVSHFDPVHEPPVGGRVLGFATDIRSQYLFVSDSTSGSTQHHVIAHEIGHALGLHHNSEGKGPAAGTSLIPGLQSNDSDFSDSSALMWWETKIGRNQCRIGVRHWDELRVANPKP